ncbi:MAG: hypothetical protein KatS3mg124_2274 [Porticoccaceae bacterium]|nr:MAG: hypothetical protein KatS3mg124_2274 [Porticoccaceae bacterium]
MAHSMTGFARVSRTAEVGELTWELRSLNHRFLEISWRLPEGLRSLEPRLRERLAGRIHRGKLEATLTFAPAAEAAAPQVDLARARGWLAAAERIAAEMADPAPLSPLEILRLPGVLVERELDAEALAAEVCSLFEASVDALLASRAAEGARLAALVRERAAAARALVASLRRSLPDTLSRLRDKLAARVAELGAELPPERLAQEVALLAQKSDVAEELDRLEAHLAEVEAALDRPEPTGRRLDFLMQELNREANTLAAKSSEAASAQAAVELKVLIEQMREQVQNLE